MTLAQASWGIGPGWQTDEAMAETEKKKKKKAELRSQKGHWGWAVATSTNSLKRDAWQAGEELYIKPEETQKPIDTSKPATQRPQT